MECDDHGERRDQLGFLPYGLPSRGSPLISLLTIMRIRDTMEALTSGLAVLADGAAILAGFLAAIWLRFNSGLIDVDSWPPNLYFLYGWGATIATFMLLFFFR